MHPENKKVTALVPVTEEGQSTEAMPAKKESYWGNVASRYSYVMRVLIVVLLLTAIVFTLVFSRMYTFDNVFSFVKDMQTVSSFVPSRYGTVYAMYSGGTTDAVLYRDGIAFAGRGGVEFYAPDGTRLLDVSREMNSPCIVASEKYLLAFDMGGGSFSVSNAYGELFAGESEFPILGGAVSDSGNFALITTARDSISRVVLYNTDFKPSYIHRNNATVGIAFTDGDTVALLGAAADNGNIRTTVDLYTLGREAADGAFVVENELPLAIGCPDGSIVLLTDKALRVCDDDGDIENKIEYTGTPVDFTVNGKGVSLVLETEAVTATNRVVVLDADGDTVYDGQHEGDVLAAAPGEQHVFLLCNGDVKCISIEKNTVESLPIEAGASDVFFVGKGAVRVIYPAKAVFVHFENS